MGRIVRQLRARLFRAGAQFGIADRLGTCWACRPRATASRRNSGKAWNTFYGCKPPDGKWPEGATTGTGFPNVFYLTYAMYRDYFPLLALSQV